jgi:CelD/BcsL family acetyltransferase involved in cellulose biosynthesis
VLTVERTETTEGFAALAAEWDPVLETSSADTLFLTWDWLYTWWRKLAGSRRLFLLTVRCGSELVAIAPLALVPARLERLVPFRSLEFLATGTVGSDYLDLIVRRGWENAAVVALSDYLRRQRLMLQLDRVRRAASLVSRLAQRLIPDGWAFQEGPMEVCPFIPLGGHTWESYLGTLGSSHRYNFQRRLKNLRKRYAVEFDRVATEVDRGPALARLLQLHEARWSSRGGSMAFSSEGLTSFHEELTRRALGRGWLRLFQLRLDGRVAASLYGFRYRDTFSFYQSGFDPAHAKDSVGLVTMGLAIQSAIEEGVGEYDFLHGDEAYKFQWAGEARELARLELYPPRWRGRLCQQAMALGRTARRTARRMFPRADRPDGRGPAPVATES